MLFKTKQTIVSCAGALLVSTLPDSALPGFLQCLGDESKDLIANNSPGYGADAVTDTILPGFP